jgi:glycosyltransferase involved in cell wall biosynthesis
MESNLTQAEMRDICWEIGTQYPFPVQDEYIAFSVIQPHRGYLNWNVEEASVARLREAQGQAFEGAALVLRVYDVTDIEFDGTNAHKYFDINIDSLSGNYYLTLQEVDRDMMAEVGFRLFDGTFHYLARSNPVYFDRERPAGHYEVDGLFVGTGFSRVFPVENIFDVAIYERLHQELGSLERQEPLAVAAVFLGLNQEAGFGGPLGSSLQRVAERCDKFGGEVRWFAPQGQEATLPQGKDFIKTVDALSEGIFARLAASHRRQPFHLVHCHDWYSARVGLLATERLQLPLVISLHSTEHERAHGSGMDHLTTAICEREKESVVGAELVIVPHSSTRQQVINIYGAAPEKVVVIPDVFVEHAAAGSSPGDVKASFGLNRNAPLVLFAGEISHSAGADLLVSALPTVCAENGDAQFVFVGDGPLRAELEHQTSHLGIGQRCRFVGDIGGDTFESLLAAADFLAIPARTWQDEGLAQMALTHGRAVLTTHQAHIQCIVHGQNGLVTYDNPGSIVWGVKELLNNPLQGSLLRLAAKQSAGQTQSIESIAAQHYIHYESLLKNRPVTA